ncbi:hypothetical protein [Spirosoma rhododendri]|nr:hypothetical protein [Spirosoma rhododendri]
MFTCRSRSQQGVLLMLVSALVGAVSYQPRLQLEPVSESLIRL